jgi:hypothetical protein
MNTVGERLYSIEHGDEFKSKLVTSLVRDASCLHCPDKYEGSVHSETPLKFKAP